MNNRQTTTQTLGNSNEKQLEWAIDVENLRITYGAVEAVKGITLQIKPKEIFGLIGPDGAGKTSTFHVLGGVMEPDSGKVEVNGTTPREGRLNIGYLTQQFSLYPDLSIEENMRYAAGLRQVDPKDFKERADKSLKQMDLYKFRARLAGQLSGGMKQKLALCCSLIARPKVLLLDEPTTGVDPVSRREFWDLLAEVSADGVTIAVATPYLDEAERCDRVALIYEGELYKVGTVSELKQDLQLHRLELRATKMFEKESLLVEKLLEKKQEIADVQTFGDRLDVLVSDLDAGEKIAKQIASEVDVNDLEVTKEEPTLENVFVTTLKREKGDSEEVEPFKFTKEKSGKSGSAIKADHLEKIFGDFHAVKDVSLEVGYGKIYGLLGANGAGKTTTIKMLCGLLEPSKGKMELAGKKSDLRDPKLRQRIGYMSQKFTLYDDLTLRENLEFYCGVYEVPEELRKQRMKWVLKVSELSGQEDMLTAKLPGGWKQRLSFGACIMHEPDILFLDEPTSGVDPLARRQLWTMISALAKHGTAILVTTHFLEEAEHCNQLGFMVAGELVAQGAPEEIKKKQPGQLIEIITSNNQQATGVIRSKIDPWRVSIFANRLHVVLDHPEQETEELLNALARENIEVKSHKDIQFSLEDAFIGIVQRASKQEKTEAVK